jgi:hypothetical protein
MRFVQIFNTSYLEKYSFKILIMIIRITNFGNNRL